MSRDVAIGATAVGKCYQMYEQPLDRLKQSFWRTRRRFYREFWALRGVTLEIRKGETVGIIGSNGSGKSTLLQVICGTLNPTEGELRIDGRIAALLELGTGFNPEFTGRENVYLNAAIMGLSRTEIDSRYDAIAAFADIGSFIEQPVKTYSSGMYVRLAFAVAINVSADILVVDEALAVGDARFQQKCMAKIRDFCRSGTVILVSHDTTAVTELCSRAVWVEGGTIRMDGPPKRVVEKYLQFMYEGTTEPRVPAVQGDAASRSHGSDRDGFVPVRNDLHQFGDRRVTIEAVRIVSCGSNDNVVYAGKKCEISVAFSAHEDVANPIAGFIVKDRLGRELLGDNTYLIEPGLSSLSAGGRYIVTFQVDAWPNLVEGDYALTVAVADGVLVDHRQCHFLHDAVIFKSVPVRVPGSGAILSVPDTKVEFFREGD
jgi:lipopolysaccharide transport system ATP-binding protein